MTCLSSLPRLTPCLQPAALFRPRETILAWPGPQACPEQCHVDVGAWPWALLPWPGSLGMMSGPLKDPTTAPQLRPPPLHWGSPAPAAPSEQGHCGFLCLPPGHCVRSRPSVGRETATVRLAASRSPFHWLEHHTLMEITYSSSWNGQPAYGKMFFFSAVTWAMTDNNLGTWLCSASKIFPTACHFTLFCLHLPHPTYYSFCIWHLVFFLYKEVQPNCISLLHKSQLQTPHDACHDILFLAFLFLTTPSIRPQPPDIL